MTCNVFVGTLNLALSVYLLSHTHICYHATACHITYGIAKIFLSVFPSICPSNVCIVTKRKKLVKTYLYHMKERLS